jgi:hypothetical protein
MRFSASSYPPAGKSSCTGDVSGPQHWRGCRFFRVTLRTVTRIYCSNFEHHRLCEPICLVYASVQYGYSHTYPQFLWISRLPLQRVIAELLGSEACALVTVAKIGRVSLACPICGATGFRSPHEEPEATDVLTCESCGLKVSYAFLLRQNLKTSTAPSEERIKASNRKPSRRRKTSKTR